MMGGWAVVQATIKRRLEMELYYDLVNIQDSALIDIKVEEVGEVRYNIYQILRPDVGSLSQFLCT